MPDSTQQSSKSLTEANNVNDLPSTVSLAFLSDPQVAGFVRIAFRYIADTSSGTTMTSPGLSPGKIW